MIKKKIFLFQGVTFLLDLFIIFFFHCIPAILSLHLSLISLADNFPHTNPSILELVFWSCLLTRLWKRQLCLWGKTEKNLHQLMTELSFCIIFMWLYHLRNVISRRQRCKSRQKKATHYLVSALNSPFENTTFLNQFFSIYTSFLN